MRLDQSRRSVLIVTVVAVVGLLIGFGLGSRISVAADPADDSAEAGFLRDMAMHHRQAVEMALTVMGTTQDPVIRSLALDIATGQQAQVGTMTGWLDAWGLNQTGATRAMTWMDHELAPGERMPGMASDEDISQLGTLPPVAADVLFLTLMRAHHIGGVDMANAILDRSDESLVTGLAERIVASQSAEILTMDDLLAERTGAGPVLPATPGAAGTPEPGHD